ncbi:MAG: rhodanese-like domain-containing protein [Planctomycetes bacterium]|nr:rhodanese-like domain-containing protein [Planctomycetota bacterium]
MIKDIGRDELKRALDSSQIEYLFDARGEEAYEKAHILGAESLPADKAEQGVGLPNNKDARIVFYCTEPT